MAGSSIIGALRVVLGADTASFEDGLKRATQQAESFTRSVTKIAAGIGLERGIEKAVEAIVGSFKEAIKSADDLGKAAQKVGVDVTELSKLKVLATLSDVSFESLTTGLGKFAKAMAEAAAGSDKAENSFQKIGVSVKDNDGKLRSVSDVFTDVASKFRNLDDGAQKTAVSMGLFGKAGKDLIPLLNQTGQSIKETLEIAEKFGLVISEKQANQSEKFNDNLKILQLATQGLANRITEALLPALVRLTDGWINTAKEGDNLKKVADRVVNVIKELVIFVQQAIVVDQLLGESLNALFKVFNAFLSLDVEEFSKQFERMTGAIDRIKPATEAVRITVNALFQDIEVESKKATGKVDEFGQGITKAIEEVGFKTDILNGRFKSLAAGFPELAKGVVPIDNIKNSVDLLDPALVKLNDKQLAFNRSQITQESLLPWQQLEKQIYLINQAFQGGAIEPQKYAQAMQQAAEKSSASWQKATVEIGQNLASGLKAFAEQNKAFAGAAKVAAIAVAVANTYVAATKALATYPPPISYVAAAAAVVAGLGYVAQIKAQNFAQGGQFKVPGGVSGRDNKLVPLNLSSGELVEITPASQAGVTGSGAGSSSSRVTEITLRGRRLTDLLTLDDMRDLIDGLNSAHRDGYRLKVVPA